MGRQTQVAMTDADEREFLAFLRGMAQIQLFESSAPSPELMAVADLAPREQGHWQYFIWNRTFAWEPEYGRVAENAFVPDRVGWAFLSNASIAPLLEYDRHDSTGPRGVTGRVYWGRQPSSLGSLSYDVRAFARWFDQVVRWIRKHGHQTRRAAHEIYFMLDAKARYQRAAEQGDEADEAR